MDYTKEITENQKAFSVNQGEGAQLYNDVEQADIQEENKRQNGKFQSAFDSSDLGSAGPRMEDYDYEKEFDEGNTFKPGPEGGVNLSNNNLKDTAISVAGRDLKSGKQFKTRFKDEMGYISKGLGMLRNSHVNTTNGAPYRDVDALTQVAQGINIEGGTYEDFLNEVEGPWSDEQKAIAWSGVSYANRVVNDANSMGNRFKKVPVEQEPEDRMTNIQMDAEEGQLITNESWIKSGRAIVDWFNPEGSAGMTDDEIHKANLTLMSQFNWNIPMAMFMANEVIESKDPEFAKAFLHLMDQYDNTDVSGASVGRAIGALFGDVTTYVTLGGSAIVGRLAAAGMKQGVKKALIKATSLTAFDVTTGAAEGAAASEARQQVEVAAGAKEKVDPVETAISAGIGAGANLFIGGAVGVMSDATLRGYAGKKLREVGQNIMKDMPEPTNIAGGRQKGHIGPIPEKPKDVEFVSRLDEEIGKFKDTMPPQKAKARLNQLIKEGKIKQTEVDWSYIEDVLEDWPNPTISRNEMLAMTKYFRPEPGIDMIKTPKWQGFAITPDGSSYGEAVIYVPPVDGQRYFTDTHFPKDMVGYDGINVGHMRYATGTYGGRKGFFLQEVQSDLQRSGNAMGFDYLDQNARVAIKEQTRKVNEVARQRDKLMLQIAEREHKNLDVPNADSVVFQAANEKEKMKLMGFDQELFELDEGITKIYDTHVTAGRPYAPFVGNRKESADLGFRASIMQAINSGSETMIWPSDIQQVAVIQNWGTEITGGSKGKGVMRYYNDQLPKLAKKYGFKVSKVNAPEISGMQSRVLDEQSIYDSGMEGAFTDHFFNQVEAKGWQFETILDEQTNEYILEIYPPNADSYRIPAPDTDYFVEEAMEFLQSYQLEPYKQIVDVNIPTEVWQIEFTPQVKEKFRKEGVNMFSVGGAAAAIGVGAQQKRDEKGRFK